MFEARKEAKLLKNLHSNELFITDLYKNGKSLMIRLLRQLVLDWIAA